jgi:hypothetical protein
MTNTAKLEAVRMFELYLQEGLIEDLGNGQYTLRENIENRDDIVFNIAVQMAEEFPLSPLN